ncbi:MAG: G8 domain-containing protein, partial [Myxococcota bacterium]
MNPPRSKAGDTRATASGLWSDPATWGGDVPGARMEVHIPEGIEITLDTETAPLHSLHVHGILRAADLDVGITADVIMVSGALEIGREGEPFTKTATINLTGEDWDKHYAPLAQGMGLKALGVMPGGRLSLVGEERLSWTKLAQTAAPGASSLELIEEVSWEAGDTIVVAPSDLDPFEAETFVLREVAGRTLSLERTTQFQHWGEVETHASRSIDMRAEVGLLSRNIVIQGDDHQDKAIGGHTMFMPDSTIHIDGVEFRGLGQRGVLARYPVHFHIAGDMTGAVVKNSSIHHSYHRCVTVHTTQNVRIEANVAYDTFGHCYFLEDGLETGNAFVRNLGIAVRTMPAEDRDGGAEDIKHDERTSVFWISNAANRFVGNVAAGAEHGMGFWFDFIERAQHDNTGEKHDTSGSYLVEFRDNVAHSTSGDGNLGYGPQQSGSGLTIERLIPMDGRAGSSIIEGFTAYKNQNHGVWSEGGHVIDGAALADNRVGIANFHHVRTSAIRDALVVGESGNQLPGAAPLRARLSPKFDGPVAVSINEGD